VSNESQDSVATLREGPRALHVKALMRNATMRLHISPLAIRDVIMLNNSKLVPSSGTGNVKTQELLDWRMFNPGIFALKRS